MMVGANLVRSIERTRKGFVLHLDEGAANLRVAPDERRAVEAAFRSMGLRVVDEFGARIDDSQFEKELLSPELLRDPAVIRGWRLVGLMLTPNWYLGWRYRCSVRQSSDDGKAD